MEKTFLRVSILLLLLVFVFFVVRGQEQPPVNDFKVFDSATGEFYPQSHTTAWGESPVLYWESGAIYLGTNDTDWDTPESVGFGVFTKFPNDLSRYRDGLLRFRAGVKVIAKTDEGLKSFYDKEKFPGLLATVHLEDMHANRSGVNLWINVDSSMREYQIPMATFGDNAAIDLENIGGLFMITVNGIEDTDSSTAAGSGAAEDEATLILILEDIRFTEEPDYIVYGRDSEVVVENPFPGPVALFSWPMQISPFEDETNLPKANPLAEDDRFGRVLSIPLSVKGAGFQGFPISLSSYHFLSFWLFSAKEDEVLVQIIDDSGNESAGVVLPGTDSTWQCLTIPLEKFTGVDIKNVAWQFQISRTKPKSGPGAMDSEIRVADVRYIVS